MRPISMLGTLLLVSPLLATPSSSSGDPFLDLSFEQALVEAEWSNRLVFIDFYTTWCGPCQRMDRETWKDKKVIHWLEQNTVAIKVDADKETELRDRYRVKGYPTLMFLDDQGYEKGRLLGFRGQRDFLSDSHDILQRAREAGELQGKVKASPKDPRLKLQLAKLLRAQSDYEQTLDLLLAAYDFPGAKGIPPLHPEELAVALAELKGLSRDFGRAREEVDVRWLIERITLLGNEPSKRGLQKFVAISTAFKFGEKALGVYDELLEGWPWGAPRPAAPENAGESGNDANHVGTLHGDLGNYDPRPELFAHVLPELVRRRRYPDILEGFGDPLVWWEGRRAELDRGDATVNPTDGEGKSRSPRARREKHQDIQRGFKRQAGQLYQALLATPGKDEQAAALAAAVIEFDGQPATWNVFLRNARAAGRKDIREALMAQAKASLPVAEHPKLSWR